jgi:hypothetical protein
MYTKTKIVIDKKHFFGYIILSEIIMNLFSHIAYNFSYGQYYDCIF